EVNGSAAQRRMCGIDVRLEVVDGGCGMVELRSLRHAHHDGRRAALEKRHLGRRLEEKRHPERVAVETDGAVEVAGADEDLADRREAEWRRGSGHTAGSC